MNRFIVSRGSTRRGGFRRLRRETERRRGLRRLAGLRRRVLRRATVVFLRVVRFRVVFRFGEFRRRVRVAAFFRRSAAWAFLMFRSEAARCLADTRRLVFRAATFFFLRFRGGLIMYRAMQSPFSFQLSA